MTKEKFFCIIKMQQKLHNEFCTGVRMRTRSESIKVAIVDFINGYFSQNGISPSIYEIASEIGVDKSTVSRYLKEMNAEGLVETDSARRSFSTEYTREYKNLKKIPIIGNIACGMPILAEQNIESSIVISSSVVGEGSFYILRAEGESMINAGIDDGDLVLVRNQSTAEEGQIVVALIDDVATLKTFFIDKANNRIRLHPENDDMQDMYFDSIKIQGVVKKIIKDCKF